MAYFYLDTSAVVKRYVTERGHVWIQSLCDPTNQHAISIAQATLAEAVVAFCRRAHDRTLSKRARDRAILAFRRDVKRSYRLERVTTAIYTRAGDLSIGHRLRAYDAIQLACALTLRDRLAPFGVVPTFVCADVALLAIAQAEGLPVDDPNAHP